MILKFFNAFLDLKRVEIMMINSLKIQPKLVILKLRFLDENIILTVICLSIVKLLRYNLWWNI